MYAFYPGAVPLAAGAEGIDKLVEQRVPGQVLRLSSYGKLVVPEIMDSPERSKGEGCVVPMVTSGKRTTVAAHRKRFLGGNPVHLCREGD